MNTVGRWLCTKAIKYSIFIRTGIGLCTTTIRYRISGVPLGQLFIILLVTVKYLEDHCVWDASTYSVSPIAYRLGSLYVVKHPCSDHQDSALRLLQNTTRKIALFSRLFTAVGQSHHPFVLLSSFPRIACLTDIPDRHILATAHHRSICTSPKELQLSINLQTREMMYGCDSRCPYEK